MTFVTFENDCNTAYLHAKNSQNDQTQERNIQI